MRDVLGAHGATSLILPWAINWSKQMKKFALAAAFAATLTIAVGALAIHAVTGVFASFFVPFCRGFVTNSNSMAT